MPAFAQRLAVLGLLCLLSSCASLLDSDQPAAQTWWLEPPSLSAVAGEQPPAPLALRVSVAPGLDSDLVMTLNPEARYSPYAGAHWADRLPELIDSLLTRSFSDSGQFSRVGAWRATDGPACRLDLQLVRFHARLDSSNLATAAEVAFEGRYRCGDDIQSLKAAASVPVSGNQMPQVVAAFQAGLQQAAQQLLAQL
jgi:ABC-type uncharacterized transport system auxiliary subunit